MAGFALAAVCVMCGRLHAVLRGGCGGQESHQYICAAQVVVEISTPALARVAPCPSCTRSQPWCACSALGVPQETWGSQWGRPPGLFRRSFGSDGFSCSLLCHESIWSFLENGRKTCNLRITDVLLLPWLAERQHFRSGNVPGFMLSLGKKGKKSRRE